MGALCTIDDQLRPRVEGSLAKGEDDQSRRKFGSEWEKERLSRRPREKRCGRGVCATCR